MGLDTLPISSNEMAALILDYNAGSLYILNVKFQVDSGSGQHQVITQKTIITFTGATFGASQIYFGKVISATDIYISGKTDSISSCGVSFPGSGGFSGFFLKTV